MNLENKPIPYIKPPTKNTLLIILLLLVLSFLRQLRFELVLSSLVVVVFCALCFCICFWVKSRMSQLARPLRQAAACARLGRQINTSAVLAQNDPIQKLFLDKLRDYGTKSKATKDGLVEPTPQLKGDMQNELERIGRVYGFQPGEDVTKFPQFSFPDPQLDPINAKQA